MVFVPWRGFLRTWIWICPISFFILGGFHHGVDRDVWHSAGNETWTDPDKPSPMVSRRKHTFPVHSQRPVSLSSPTSKGRFVFRLKVTRSGMIPLNHFLSSTAVHSPTPRFGNEPLWTSFRESPEEKRCIPTPRFVDDSR